MAGLLMLLLTFMIHQSVIIADSNSKCSTWLDASPKILNCCKIPLVFNRNRTEQIQTQATKNGTFNLCDYFHKMAEDVNLQVFDRAAYKTFVKNITNDKDWEPVMSKNIDFCLDLVPKIVDSFSKGTKMNADKCGLRFALTGMCMGQSNFADCPTKSFTDSSECKDLKVTVKECLQSPEEINKFFTQSTI